MAGPAGLVDSCRPHAAGGALWKAPSLCSTRLCVHGLFARSFRHRNRFTTARLSLTQHRRRAGQPLSTRTAAAAVEQPTETESTPSDDPNDLTPEEESLQLLEWPALCRQVAAFCGTSMAAEQLVSGALPLGSTQQHSELLLQQTAEALQAGLKVSGVLDLRPLLAGLAAGGVCNARQLEGFATTLEAAFTLKQEACRAAGDNTSTSSNHSSGSSSSSSRSRRDSTAGKSPGPAATKQSQQDSSSKSSSSQQQQQQPAYPTLAALAAGIPEQQRATLQELRRCVQSGFLLEEASPRLAAVRAARTTNAAQLRSLVGDIASKLAAAKGSDTKEPVLIRGRLAVAVNKGSRGMLTKGSMRLGASGSGATLYVEPAEALELNNRAVALEEEEAAEEEAVLVALSRMLAAAWPGLESLLSAVTELDVVAARAAHAAWLGGVRPVFASWDSAPRPSPLEVPGALHPLLLAGSLAPLPRPPSRDDLTPDLVEAPAWALPAEEGQQQGQGRQQGMVGGRGPHLLQLVVPRGAKVVAITGPNTGGKTVTLKTAGLMALMAKAGCFLPAAPTQQDTGRHQDQQQQLVHSNSSSNGSSNGNSNSNSSSSGTGTEAAAPPPRLLWYDAVLVDIGDSQSLQQSLSTFSGHVRRLRRVLWAASRHSLVLLDEVGSGTDPLEGAALARSVLDVLAGRAGLTIATTHHAELKTAADEDDRYVNVSMGFDTAALRPTYTLHWGTAGASNALDIAAALGFDSAVLADARQLLAAQHAQHASFPTSSGSSMEEVAVAVEQQLEVLQQELEQVQQQRAAAEAALQEATAAVAALKTTQRALRGAPQRIRLEAATAVLRLQVALVQFRRGELGEAQLQAAFQPLLDKAAAAAGGEGPAGLTFPSIPGQQPQQQGSPVFSVGDRVLLKDMGDLGPAVVTRVKGGTVWVSTLLGELRRSQADLLPQLE